MKRWLSIFLVLVFGVGPLVATLAASDESRLPFCCRRQGVHHCAMSTQTAAMIGASAPALNIKAPPTCPWFPCNSVALNTTALALALTPVGLPALLAQTHSPATGRAAARISQVRTRAGRGPPASSLP
jgi:hypothetical protein